MITVKILRNFLRKTVDRLITAQFVSEQLIMENKSSFEILQYLEEQGYLEKISHQLWVLSTRGKIVAFSDQKRIFKAETLNRNLYKLVKRIQHVNTSTDYPDEVCCMKIIGIYPIHSRSASMNIAYSIKRKKLCDEDYNKAASKLRRKHRGEFANYVERIFYPQMAIRLFLKASSPALTLKQYSSEEIKLLEGTVLFEKDFA